VSSLSPAVCGSKLTVAASVARFTSALSTPSIRDSAFSTCRTQEAQVMPPMSRVQMELELVAVVIVVP
jgi:hypothetical protein